MKIIETYNETEYTPEETMRMQPKKGEFHAERLRRAAQCKKLSLPFKITYGIILGPAILALLFFLIGWILILLLLLLSLFSKSLRTWDNEVLAPFVNNVSASVLHAYESVCSWFVNDHIVLFWIIVIILLLIAAAAAVGLFIKGRNYCENCELRNAYAKTPTLLESTASRVEKTSTQKQTAYVKDRYGAVVSARDVDVNVTQTGLKTTRKYRVVHECTNCGDRYYTIEVDSGTSWQ